MNRGRRTSRSTGDPEAALVYRAELQRDGRPTDPEGQAKQLVLSVALTEPLYRCERYGDARFCPFCAMGEPVVDSCASSAYRQADVIQRQVEAFLCLFKKGDKPRADLIRGLCSVGQCRHFECGHARKLPSTPS